MDYIIEDDIILGPPVNVPSAKNLGRAAAMSVYGYTRLETGTGPTMNIVKFTMNIFIR